jgi:hypothetical protein
MPEGAIYVGRPTPWGSPFYIGQYGDARNWLGWYATTQSDTEHFHTKDEALARTVEVYREWTAGADGFPTSYVIDGHTYSRRWVLANLDQLRGKDLACWCRVGQPCHADRLLELANPPLEPSDA